MTNKNYLQKISILFLMFFVLISGCTNITQIKEDKINDDLKFRIGLLYGHTLIMEQYSSKEALKKLGIDVTVLDNQSFLSPEKKIEILEKSYGIEKQGTYENRVKTLEVKMNEIMQSYYVNNTTVKK